MINLGKSLIRDWNINLIFLISGFPRSSLSGKDSNAWGFFREKSQGSEALRKGSFQKPCFQTEYHRGDKLGGDMEFMPATCFHWPTLSEVVENHWYSAISTCWELLQKIKEWKVGQDMYIFHCEWGLWNRNRSPAASAPQQTSLDDYLYAHLVLTSFT